MDNSSLFIGWFLGVASAVLVERIGSAARTKRASEVIQTELEELRLQLVFNVFHVKNRLGMLTREDVEAMKVIANAYQGVKQNEQFKKFRKAVNGMDDKILGAIQLLGFKPGHGIGLKTQSTPAIDNSIGFVGGFPKPYQAAVLEIRRILNVFNQEVETSHRLNDMTFDASIVGTNRTAIDSNTETSWKTIVDQAEDAIELINQTDEYRGRTFWSFLF